MGSSTKMPRQVGNKNEIQLYFHCGHCLEQMPAGLSPREWSQIEAGWTPPGFQVICKRCGRNIVHVDFQGQQHPANLSGGSGYEDGRLFGIEDDMARGLFHELWTWAVGKKGYAKTTWQELQNRITKLGIKL